MFPSQTSLIPVTVALTRFLLERGPSAFFQIYPFWYLGSTPFRYLTGPVVPLFEYGIKNIVPGVSLFDLSIYLILSSYLIGVTAWIILIKKINQSSIKISLNIIIFALVIYIISPWKYISGLAIQETTAVLAKGVLPFCLIFLWNYISSTNLKNLLLSSFFLAVLFLINTNILATLIVGIAALAVAKSYKDGKVRHLDRKLKKIILPLFIGLFIATFWYGPAFWWVQLTNPGIGGAAGFSVIAKVVNFIKNIAPLILAVIVVYFNTKIKNRLTVFALIWSLTFSILTLYRFLANPEFWMDWISWVGEIEIGIMLLLVGLNLDFNFKDINFKKISLSLALFLIPCLLSYFLFIKLGKPELITNHLPESTYSLNLLTKIPADSTVYITGSNAFWLNSLLHIKQVRGGRDEVSVNNDWLKASYELRESQKAEIIARDITKLGIKYILINTSKSLDFYKDYKNLKVWDALGKKIGFVNGDYLLEE